MHRIYQAKSGEEAVRLADYILNSKKIEILEVDEEGDDDKKLGKILEGALTKFKKNSEMRGLSFTDCTTLALLEKMKIKCILSFDSNFRPFVPRLFGEGYRVSLAREENVILTNAAEKLGIEL